MRGLSLAVLAIVTAGSTHIVAFAADMPVKAPIYSTPAAVLQYNWTGFYIGIEGGGGWGRSRHLTPPLPFEISDKFKVDGGIIGGTAGFNWQTGPVVFGIEGDLSHSSIQGSTRGVPPAFCPPGGPLANCATDLRWLGTMRGRVGYAWNYILPYATGGAAFGNLRGSTDNGGNSGSATRTGWTIGGGVEAMFARNWSAKVEYLHVDLGTANSLFIRNPGAFPFNVGFSTNIVRAGLNYKFGP